MPADEADIHSLLPHQRIADWLPVQRANPLHRGICPRKLRRHQHVAVVRQTPGARIEQLVQRRFQGQAIRLAYQKEIRSFIERYKKECQGVRADFVTVDNSMTFDKALVEFLSQRRSRF